jgi:hypothetical protein
MARNAFGEVYDDSADLGLFLVSVAVLIAVVVAVVMLLYSVLLMFQHDSHDESVMGKVTSANCKKMKNGLYRCEVDVSYQVGDKTLTLMTEVDQKSAVKVGDSLKVRYDDERPEDAVVGAGPRQLSMMMLGGGLITLLCAIVALWMTRRFKLLAAAQGGVAVLSLF